jgi:HSP20 family protein
MKELAARRETGMTLPGNLGRLHEEVDRLFSRFFGEFTPMEVVGSAIVDIREDEKSIYVDAELPGMSKEDVEVSIENGLLTISGEKKIEHQAKGREDLKERYFGRIYRSLTLPSQVNENTVKATMADGILHLTLEKVEQPKARRIEIE